MVMKSKSKGMMNLHISNIDLYAALFGVILIFLTNFPSLLSFLLDNFLYTNIPGLSHPIQIYGGMEIYLVGTILVLLGTISAAIRKSPFLKPDKKKVILTIFLLILSIAFFYYVFIPYDIESSISMCPLCAAPSYSLPWEPCSCYPGAPDLSTSITIEIFSILSYIDSITSFFTFFILPYFLSCLIVFIYENFKKMKRKNKYYCILGVVIILSFIVLLTYLSSDTLYHLSSESTANCTTTFDWKESGISYNKTECMQQEKIYPDKFKWENETCWSLWTDTSCVPWNYSNS